MKRRTFVVGSASFIGSAGFFLKTPFAYSRSNASNGRSSYVEYDFVDYFGPEFQEVRGRNPSLNADIKAAEAILDSMPQKNNFDIMTALSKIKQKGSKGELFNERWRSIANPLIVKFFHDIGYKRTPYPGDCTPWCAATVSWCLQRSGLPLPPDPASSQSFLRYGQRVGRPQTGDICVFTSRSDPAHGHVGMFVSFHEMQRPTRRWVNLR